jgi:hypothetical protein
MRHNFEFPALLFGLGVSAAEAPKQKRGKFTGLPELLTVQIYYIDTLIGSSDTALLYFPRFFCATHTKAREIQFSNFWLLPKL